MLVLCQNCLAFQDVERLVMEEAEGEGLCNCGGDVCDCKSCVTDEDRMDLIGLVEQQIYLDW